MIKNAGYNASIAVGSVILFEFNGDNGFASDEPTNYLLVNEKPNNNPVPELDNREIVETVLANIMIGYQGKDSKESVTQNITLPCNTSSIMEGVENVNIVWSSSDESLIDYNGTVNRPYDESEWVTLTVTVSLEEELVSKDYDLRVVKSIYDDYNINYIEDYDEYEYLYAFNDWGIDENFHIYEDKDGYMNYLVGSYTDVAIDSPEEALLSLYHVKTLLGLTDPLSELEYVQTSSDDAIIRFRFRQMYHGVPVKNSEIYVVTDFNGITKVINSSIVHNIDVDVNPTISEEAAIKSLSFAYMDAYSEGLIIDTQDGENELAWKLNAKNEDGDSFVVFVSALNGKCLSELGNVQRYEKDEPKNVKGQGYLEGYNLLFYDDFYHLQDITRNISTYCWNYHKELQENDEPFGQYENGSWEDDDNVKITASEYKNVVDAYDYFESRFGRKGCDGNNGHLILFTRYIPGNTSYHGINANGEHFIQIGDVYSDSKKVATHEFTHGVINSETNLNPSNYNGIPGAINEGYADVFGQLSLNTPDWKMDNRDLRSVPDSIDPNADIYLNSQFVSYICYRMCTNGISKDKVESIWYTSLLLGYSGNETSFEKVRQNVLAAATLQGASLVEYYTISKAFNDAGIEVSEVGTTGTNTLSGVITKADTDNLLCNNTRLSGVSLTLQNGKRVKYNLTTDSEGNYLFTNLLPGEYLLTCTKSGYYSTTMKVNISGVITTHYAQTIELIPTTYIGKGNAKGTITDAITGKPIEGLMLEVRSGLNFSEKKDPILCTLTTDAYGQYELSNFSTGHYCITIKDSRTGVDASDKYITNNFNVKVLSGYTINNQNATVTTKLNSGQLRIVLEWGERPYDLDSHFYLPYTSGAVEIYYGNKVYSKNGATVALLDVDDVNSYGPETTTLYAPTDGEYYFQSIIIQELQRLIHQKLLLRCIRTIRANQRMCLQFLPNRLI